MGLMINCDFGHIKYKRLNENDAKHPRAIDQVWVESSQ
jgi:hypothetical protein